MKISTKGTYGMIALIDICINSENNKVVTVNSISERHNISKIYLEQIVGSLKKNGIITSNKGPRGGYKLNQSPEAIKISDVIKALEGNIFEVPDFKNVENDVCKFLEANLWGQIKLNLESYLSKITLIDLVDDYKKTNNNLMFYI